MQCPHVDVRGIGISRGFEDLEKSTIPRGIRPTAHAAHDRAGPTASGRLARPWHVTIEDARGSDNRDVVLRIKQWPREQPNT
jgi:hypothetical protein